MVAGDSLFMIEDYSVDPMLDYSFLLSFLGPSV